MQAHQTKRSFWQWTHKPVLLFWIYLLVNLAPTFYFLAVQPLDWIGKIVILCFPIGFFGFFLSIFRNAGTAQIILFPLFILHAFQIVLFYLFGGDLIAVDMFLNVATTNTSEINELLGSLLPSIFLVIILYLPPTILAIIQWKRRERLSNKFRIKAIVASLILVIIAFLLSFEGENKNTGILVFNQDVYPINALHNLGFAVNKWDKVKQYPETSADFTFEAIRVKDSLQTEREIFVLIIGETSRADNWSLYGYDRETNPELKKQENLFVFKDALTQSNTTHKSVSIILSDAEAESYNSIYNKKGIISAFKEVGFTTICLSNQAENGSFIEYFTKEADIYQTIRTTDPKTGLTINNYDEALLPILEKLIDKNKGDLFIVLHTYGSHFNYMERYPESFKKFESDQVAGVSKSEKDHLVNAYDNSILYTDHFLNQTIETLKKTKAAVAMLYTADHGEDLFDDDRGRFLHASPTPTYYQLRIPIVMWFSDQFKATNTIKMEAIEKNVEIPISTNAVFHTMLNAANIETKYLEKDLSLVHPSFTARPRMYLNDHDIAVPYLKMNLKPEDFEMLKKNNIKP